MSKEKGVVQARDGISRCESSSDLYAFVRRRPDGQQIKMSPSETEEPAIAIGREMRREALARIEAGEWSGSSRFLVIFGYLIRYLFWIVAFPLYFLGYLIPKWIICLCLAVGVWSFRRVREIGRYFGRGGERLKGAFCGGIERIKGAWCAFACWLHKLVALFCYPFVWLGKSCGEMWRALCVKWTRLSEIVDEGIERAVGVPRRFFVQIGSGMEWIGDKRVEARAWLLEAPFRLLAWLRRKVERLEEHLNRWGDKVKAVAIRFGEWLDVVLLAIAQRMRNVCLGVAQLLCLGKLMQLAIRALEGVRRGKKRFQEAIDGLVQKARKPFGMLVNLFSMRSRIAQGVSNRVRLAIGAALDRVTHGGKALCRRSIAWIGKGQERALGAVQTSCVRVKEVSRSFFASEGIRRGLSQMGSIPGLIGGSKAMRSAVVYGGAFGGKLQSVALFLGRIGYGFRLTWAWGAASVEYATHQMQSVAIAIEGKFPLAMLLAHSFK